MSDYVIPCGTFVRLSKILRVMTHDASEWFNSMRIDDGVAVASNRTILGCELIGGPSGIIHIKNDPVLIEQCAKEMTFDSNLYITVNPALRFAAAKTSLGYVHPGNCVIWSDASNEMDAWRSIIPREPAKQPRGALSMNAEHIADLAASSPSGRVVFEAVIDDHRPCIIRDVLDDNWFGAFIPNLTLNYPPAKLPDWFAE